jgi:radical SAM protein with 4Fe4S-binding SPASM domain
MSNPLINQLPYRYTAWLTINRGCQLRCKWCYASESGFKSKMSSSTFDKALNLLKGVNVKTVTLIGGEPTIDPNFFDYVEGLKTAGFHVTVITNGIKFADHQFTEKCFTSGVGHITVSLKAPTDEGYFEITQKHALSQVLQGLSNLKERGKENPIHMLSVVLSGGMLKDIDKLISLIQQSGVPSVTFDTERPIMECNETKYDGVEPKEIVDFIVTAFPKLETMGVEYKIHITHPFCLFPAGFIDELKDRNRLISGCQIFNGKGLIIDENGGILPCNHFCSNKLGTLDECPTGDDYLKWRTREDIAGFYSKVGDYPTKQCTTCQSWSECGGGCRINWLHFDKSKLLGDNKNKRRVNQD